MWPAVWPPLLLFYRPSNLFETIPIEIVIMIQEEQIFPFFALLVLIHNVSLFNVFSALASQGLVLKLPEHQFIASILFFSHGNSSFLGVFYVSPFFFSHFHVCYNRKVQKINLCRHRDAKVSGLCGTAVWGQNAPRLFRSMLFLPDSAFYVEYSHIPRFHTILFGIA